MAKENIRKLYFLFNIVQQFICKIFGSKLVLNKTLWHDFYMTTAGKHILLHSSCNTVCTGITLVYIGSKHVQSYYILNQKRYFSCRCPYLFVRFYGSCALILIFLFSKYLILWSRYSKEVFENTLTFISFVCYNLDLEREMNSIHAFRCKHITIAIKLFSLASDLYFYRNKY